MKAGFREKGSLVSVLSDVTRKEKRSGADRMFESRWTPPSAKYSGSLWGNLEKKRKAGSGKKVHLSASFLTRLKKSEDQSGKNGYCPWPRCTPVKEN